MKNYSFTAFEKHSNKYLFVFLALVNLLVTSAFIEGSFYRQIYFAIAITLVLATELYADQSPVNFLPELLLGLLAVAMTWLHLTDIHSHDLQLYTMLTYAAYFSYSIFILIRKITASKEVTSNIIYASVNVYIISGVLGAVLATLNELIIPGSFHFDTPSTSFRLDNFIYYSFITLTTVGYGDVLPVKPLAKMLSVCLVLFGQIYLTIIVTILVGKYMSRRVEEKEV
jgi:voltage-gated potassium channel